MTLAVLFWMLFILWLVIGMWGWAAGPPTSPQWSYWANWVILSGMLFTLGWAALGFIVKGP